MSNFRFVLNNMAFLVLANLIIKPFWIFGIELKVQNLLGPVIYGNYFSLYNFVVLFMVFLDWGINNYNNRNISRNPEQLTQQFSSIFFLKIFIAFFYSILVFAIASFIGYDTNQKSLLIWLVCSQILLSYIMFFRSNLGALQLFKQDSLISILDKSLMIVFCAFLIWGSLNKFSEFTIQHFVKAQTVGYFLTALVGFFLIFRKARSFKPTVKASTFKNILNETYPFALLALLMGVYSRIDGVMLERMLPNGKEEAGIYAAAYRLLDAFNQFALLIGTILYPVFSKKIKNNEPVWQLSWIFGGLIGASSLILAFICYFFQQEIMHFLYNEATMYYGKTFGLLMFSFVGMASVYVYGSLLTANGSLKILNYIALSGVVLNILLNLALIPSLQAYGATIATVITQSLVAIVHVIFVWIVFKKSDGSKNVALKPEN